MCRLQSHMCETDIIVKSRFEAAFEMTMICWRTDTLFSACSGLLSVYKKRIIKCLTKTVVPLVGFHAVHGLGHCKVQSSKNGVSPDTAYKYCFSMSRITGT